jgi:DNA repair photolyase
MCLYKFTITNYLVYNVINDLDNTIVIPKNIKSQAALVKTQNSSEKLSKYNFEDGSYFDEEFFTTVQETSYTTIYPKTLVEKVVSPDIPSDWSMNPYQGCEHGCVYCYARTTHEYWGYSKATDFEKNILIKENAPELLLKKIKSRSWSGQPIMLSGDTDCYQPAEQKYEITRKLLQICLDHNQPVKINTKNALICRDIDILEKLAAKNLIQVHISITTLDEQLRKAMEPHTSSAKQRLQTIAKLSQQNIPVHVMLAPIIPGLNSDEIFDICAAVSNAGASSLGHTMVRLNGVIALLFEDWIQKTFPLKATRVMNLISATQGGKLGGSNFGKRMQTIGTFAISINEQVRLAKKKHGLAIKPKPLNTNAYKTLPTIQLHLF